MPATVTHKPDKQIYLAGSMEWRPDGGIAWREHATERLAEFGFTVFNPTKQEHKILARHGISSLEEMKLLKGTDYPIYQALMRDILHYDIDALNQSCAVLVLADSWIAGGTAGEMTHAYLNDIPVYAVFDKGYTPQQMSGWLGACVTQFYPDFTQAALGIFKWTKPKESS